MGFDHQTRLLVTCEELVGQVLFPAVRDSAPESLASVAADFFACRSDGELAMLAMSLLIIFAERQPSVEEDALRTQLYVAAVAKDDFPRARLIQELMREGFALDDALVASALPESDDE